MKILALDSSGLVASVAILSEGVITGEYTINYKITHSQTLMPMLDEVCRRIELDISTIDAIAVAAGPGSFTGLRIGSATAKGLGLALRKPLIAIPTLEALAYNLYGSRAMVCPLMDARRNQVYTGIYAFERNEEGYALRTVKEQCAADILELIEDINKKGAEVIFLGDGVPVFKEVLEQNVKVPYSFAPAHMNRQRAASVAALGGVYYLLGNVQTPEEHEPDYLRPSQAERERMEQEEKLRNEK